MKNETHEKLWSELRDCVAAKVDGEQLCFPAEIDDCGDQINLEINDGEHYLLIDRNNPVECNEIMAGVFEILAQDERGKIQKYEIQPLFGRD
jgi:hypothetical protein